MIRINYISNLDVNNPTGGWSGMNYHIYRQLATTFDVTVVDKVDPPVPLYDKIVSKFLRSINVRGQFPSFSKTRLQQISRQVSDRLDDSSRVNFYHGSTPWLFTENNLPYACYLDCCFSSYINVYHRTGNFSKKQLDYLFKKEKYFLEQACVVFFSSAWALNDAKLHYDIQTSNLLVAGLGGAETNVLHSNTKSDRYFLFVALDFAGKGGYELVEAFNLLHKEFPDYGLKIVGQKPPDGLRLNGNIEYIGMLDKSNDKDVFRLLQLYLNAYCFVLPTAKDMTPLVLLEAMGAGCPVISTRRFGIPEMVLENETGILLDMDSPMVDQLMTAMKEMIINRQMRDRYSKNARSFSQQNFTWNRTGDIIRTTLAQRLPHA